MTLYKDESNTALKSPIPFQVGVEVKRNDLQNDKLESSSVRSLLRRTTPWTVDGSPQTKSNPTQFNAHSKKGISNRSKRPSADEVLPKKRHIRSKHNLLQPKLTFSEKNKGILH
jgi:hypothetical protein